MEENIIFGSKGLIFLIKKLKADQYSSIFVLTDTNTNTNCLDRFLKETNLNNCKILTMNAGEENKNLRTCEKLWNELSELGADRNSLLINLGGGVVTDLGGFVACTFKRGIDFYNIPTTLLSMVDASIGGKTGIDLGVLKNQIGIIKEPKFILIDTKWLETLPQDEIRSGFAEMLKHGLICDPQYWKELKFIRSISEKYLVPFIKPSIQIKSNVVSEDPIEKGIRKVLNFGHTLGHAIESYFLIHTTKNKLLHGEAIAIGMVLEAYLSTQLVGLNKEEAKEIKETFARFYPQINFRLEEVNEILELLRHDKKNKAGLINFVLLKSIGSPVIDVQVPEHLYAKAFDFYKNI